MEPNTYNWATSYVISEIDGHSFRGKVEITHHQPALFIMASKSPYDLQPIREAMEDKNVETVSSVPELDMTLESYVRLSILPEKMQTEIRKFLTEIVNDLYLVKHY